MEKEELLEFFLSEHPDSTHPCDQKRFFKYAIACAKDDCSAIDIETMRKSGKMSEEMIHYYDLIYPWIRDTYQYALKTVFEELKGEESLPFSKK